MNGTIEPFTTHRYAAVFAWVLAEQLGLPLPAVPVLLAAGALAGNLDIFPVWLLAVAAALIGDSVWYSLGRMQGMPVLRLLCKISLEPNTCVRRTNSAYSRHGSRWLLFAKFIPGVSTIAPPMAGVYGMSFGKFLAMDGGGAALWAGVFISAGAAFRGQADAIVSGLERLGGWLGAAVAAVLAIWVLLRFIERQRIYRSLRKTSIGPLELKERMDSGEAITIVDLRDVMECREGRIPGSRAFSDEELDTLAPTIAGTEMVLYCSCPDEISSAARMAMRLKRAGIRVVRPLEGGFPGWKHLGFPVEISV